MRSIGIPTHIKQLMDPVANTNASRTAFIKEHYRKLLHGAPEVSVVIPAYNEEKDILQTLHALTANVTARSVEIIVVNNNSKDNTEARPWQTIMMWRLLMAAFRSYLQVLRRASPTFSMSTWPTLSGM